MNIKDQSKEEAEIAIEFDEDEEEVFYNKWEIAAEAQFRGPDRCLLGHALHKCKETALLVLDEEDDSVYKTVNGG